MGLGLGNPPPWEHGLEGRLLQAGLGLRGAECVLLWWQVTTPQRWDRILSYTKEADLGYPEIKFNQSNQSSRCCSKAVSGKSRPVSKGQGETCGSLLPPPSECWGDRACPHTAKNLGAWGQAPCEGVREHFVLVPPAQQTQPAPYFPPPLQGKAGVHNMNCGVPGWAVPAAAGCKWSLSTLHSGAAGEPSWSAVPRLHVPTCPRLLPQEEMGIPPRVQLEWLRATFTCVLIRSFC